MINEQEAHETKDLVDDMGKREQLLEEAKRLDKEATWDEVADQVLDLQKRWKRIPYFDSAYEDALQEEFDDCLNVFYSKRKAGFINNQEAKQTLISRTKELLEKQEWRQGNALMHTMMEEWKAIGSAGRELDDALWEEFKKARQKFYDEKHHYYESLKEKFAEAKAVKETLIEEAKALKESEEWNKTSEKYRNLMQRWKEVGSAGKEFEDALWESFQAQRQYFYDRREQHYNAMREEHQKNLVQKEAMIERAKVINEEKAYTKEHTQEMKQLGVNWKEVGSCGKEKDDEIWKAFREQMDIYFEGLREWNQQRHLQWRQRMMEQRNRKLELIQNQKRLIHRMQEEIVGLLGQRAIDEMEERIQDKEQFIKELQQQVEEIDERLEEDAKKQQA